MRSLAILVLSLCATRAHAQTCGTSAAWSSTNEVGNVSLAVSGTSSTFFAIGSKLHALDATAGTAVGSFTAGGAIQTAASTAPLADGSWYVFVTAFDGRLYKLANTTLTAIWSGGVDLRRSTCTADEINATPAVQLAAYSSSAFRTAHSNKDLVYVITRYGCLTSSANRIYAVDAASGSIEWTFNATGTSPMDFGSEGCSIDYTNDRIYCGTNQPLLGTQSTLWAISTIDGSLAWSTNAGSLQNRPQLASGRVYVANTSGTLAAYDTSGNLKWSKPVSTVAFQRNPWVEFRAPYASNVYITDISGVLWDVKDNGTSATTTWSASLSGHRIMSEIGISPATGFAYVGLDNGTVHQLSLADGSDNASRTVGGSSDIAVDPNLATGTTGTIDWITISTQGLTSTTTKRFCLPWAPGSTGS